MLATHPEIIGVKFLLWSSEDGLFVDPDSSVASEAFIVQPLNAQHIQSQTQM